jgi:hypothetical protein
MAIDTINIDENERAHATLKMMLLQQIAAEDQTQKILRKIFRRISLIYVVFSAIIILSLTFLIYTTNKPESKASVALKEMEALNTRITLQRQYIEIDRKDLEKTREAVNKLIKIQDSIIK